MKNKYWVPALERADYILRSISEHPGKLRLIDLAKMHDINKSSMFSLLNTMESLRWIVKEPGDVYSLGANLGVLGHAYFHQFNFIEWFTREAEHTKAVMQETVQLAKLDGSHVLYMAKVEADSPVRLITEPGMRLPAYATALGKVLLAELDTSMLDLLLPIEPYAQLTPHTLQTKQVLQEELAGIKQRGYGIDSEEAVIGFCCVASPVIRNDEAAMYAVSLSLPKHHWEHKQKQAVSEIKQLAKRLSMVRKP